MELKYVLITRPKYLNLGYLIAADKELLEIYEGN